MKKQAKGPKFRVGQVVYDIYERQYFKCDADLAKELNAKGATEGIRQLTVREAGPARGRKRT